MPDEMKGARSFHEVLRRLGIQNPGEVNIQKPVVLTANVGDYTQLERPLGYWSYWFHAATGSGGGTDYTGFWITAGGGGVWFDSIRNAVPNLWYWTVESGGTMPAPAGATAVLVPGCSFGDGAAAARASVITEGTGLLAAWNQPANAVWIQSTTSTGLWHPSVYIHPGDTLVIKQAAINTQMLCTCMFREIPIGG